MSSTDLPSATEDSEMLESDGEKVVTMMDVLQEQQDFEDDANAVLGASDEKNCTYPKGYIKRQAVFACLTCCTEAKTDPTKAAGVCLACSLSCHENHEVIELYTKRNFCCDCGNPKFNSNPCQFLPQKPDMNVNNKYNQNFSGLYCICHRPYPDPESTFDDEMIQCIVCEDWLHASHLEAPVPPNEQYSEMICKACMQKNEFLYDYSDLAVNVDIEIDVVSVNGTESSACNGTVCNGNDDEKEIDKEREKSGLDVEMAEKSDKHAEPSVEVGKEMSDKPSESSVEGENEKSDKSADLVSEDKKENHEMVTTENIELNNSTESVPKMDSEMPMDAEETKDEPADSSEKQELKESNSKENESALAADIASETSATNTDEAVPKSKGDNPESSADKSETVSEQNNSETKTAEKDNDAEVKDSENIEQKVVKENADTSETKETQDDVLESIDKIINDEPSSNDTADKAKEDDKSVNNDTEIKENDGDEGKAANKDTDTEENIKKDDVDDAKSEANEEKNNENKRKLDEETDTNNITMKKPKLENSKGCNRPRDAKKKLKGAAFWPSNFRQMLCTCNECLTMYKDLSVLFLTDPEDTVSAYEMLGKEMTEAFGASQYEKGLQALSSLDRIQQINALTEYNKMRDKLLEFLKSFKDRQEIVKEEDIKAFFAGMKPKREPDGVYFCR